MTRITVVGTGYTGGRILKRLPADEADGISRSIPEGVDAGRITRLDLDDELPPITTATSVVYTVAPPRDGTDGRIERLFQAFSTPPQRFVYLSTTGVYGDRQGRRVVETDDVAPATGRAGQRIKAEQLLDSLCEASGCSLVVLRVPGIYGPGRLGTDRIRDGEPMLDERAANPGNRIHVDDLVSCCIAAADLDMPAGVYNVGDGDTRSSTWFSSEVARQLGVEPGPQISRAQAEREFSAMRLSFLSESRIVDTTKMREVLGVEPRYANAEDGIRASLEDAGQTSD